MINIHNVQDNKKQKLRVRLLDRKLKKVFPHARCSLMYRTPFELLVAVILSARCTDKKVNQVTASLFKKYTTIIAFADAPIIQLEKDIFQTGFYRNKAKHIKASARMVVDVYKGKVPRTMKQLCALPGVARKTANVVLGNAYGVVDGIAVDTHVSRFAQKFDLTGSSDPKQIEKDLMAIVPQNDWLSFTYRVIEYGRTVCPAKKHNCHNCFLSKIYPLAATHTFL